MTQNERNMKDTQKGVKVWEIYAFPSFVFN